MAIWRSKPHPVPAPTGLMGYLEWDWLGADGAGKGAVCCMKPLDDNYYLKKGDMISLCISDEPVRNAIGPVRRLAQLEAMGAASFLKQDVVWWWVEVIT